jgi:hypothetical protein
VELCLHSPNTPSWRGAQLKHRDNFTFTFNDRSRFYNAVSLKSLLRAHETWEQRGTKEISRGVDKLLCDVKYRMKLGTIRHGYITKDVRNHMQTSEIRGR